ncbi:MAG: DVUA0089 family protein [Verrucomicrobiales bacterium]
MNRFKLSLAVLSCVSSFAWGAAPALEYLYPAGGSVGSQFVLTTGGSAEPWPVKAWCDDPAVVITAQTNKNKFDVVIGANAIPGIHLIRLWNNDGSSAPRAFSVGLNPELEEKDPNNNLKQATNAFPLPITINGKFEKHNDNDTFAVDLMAGKTFVAQMEGYRLGSMMDPAMHLFDATGKRIAFNHDFGTLDPFLFHIPANSGRYYIQILAFNHPASVNVNFLGNAAAVYRLSLSQGPFAQMLWPLAIQRDSTHPVAMKGPNIDQDAVSVNTLALSPELPLHFQFPPGYSNAVPMLLSDGLATLEKEPNNSTDEAQKVAVPLSVSGVISHLDRFDRFAFEAKKDQSFVLTLWSARLGSGLNCVIKVEDENGAELGRSDIRTEARDPSLNWKAPRDGTFHASVTDLRSSKWKEGVYHLFLEEDKPGFKATVDAHSFQFESGKTNEIPFKVVRKGFDETLLCSIQNLPPDARLLTKEIPAKESGPLKVFVPEGLTNWQGSIQIILTATNQMASKAMFNLQGSDDEHAGLWFQPETSHLWLNVSGKK